jgi:uncharacterized protein YggE
VRVLAITEGGSPMAGPSPTADTMREMRRGESKTEVAAGEAEVTATVSVRFLLR